MDVQPFQPDAQSTLADMSRRLRAVEDRLEDIGQKADIVNDTIGKRTQAHEEGIMTALRTLGTLQQDMTELKKEIKEIRRELLRSASVEKVQELEGYISMINPMKFVTHDEVNKMLKDLKHEEE